MEFPFRRGGAVDSPNIVEYGHGIRGRKLINGKYVLEETGTGYGLDLKVPGLRWSKGTRFYKDCISTKKRLDRRIKSIMVNLGYSETS